jgi:hypothetical protein
METNMKEENERENQDKPRKERIKKEDGITATRSHILNCSLDIP